MRGFSMIIVVLGHVLIQMGIGGYDSFLSSLLLTFRMPLFFFVSGYFSYRAVDWWSRPRVIDILKRKIQAQIICTLVFIAILDLCTGSDIDYSAGFGGYWFTIVLFQMYIIYLAVSLGSRLLRYNLVIPSLVLISCYGVYLLVAGSRSGWAWNFFVWENLAKYMQFFTLGIICSKFKDKFFKTLDTDIFTTAMIVGWVLCMAIWYRPEWIGGMGVLYHFIHDIAVRYFALMAVVGVFYHNRIRLSGNSRISRNLKYIGTRTLDIYMIHYLLLPSLAFTTAFWNSANTFIFQLCVSASIAIIIVALCLLISSVIRESKTLEQWLFGVRPRRATDASKQI